MTPTARRRELVEAAREFVERSCCPTLDDHRLRFRTLVALNALGIADARAGRASPAADEPDWELARRIRAGDVPAGRARALKADVEAKLRVASPRLPRARP